MNKGIELPLPKWLSNDFDDPWKRAYALWLLEFRSARTRKNYNTGWQYFDRFSGGELHAKDVTEEHVRAFKIWLDNQKYSEATVNLHLSSLSSFYEFIVEKYPGLMKSNPVAGVKRYKVDPYGKATFMDEDQDIKFMQATTSFPLMEQALFWMFMTMGFRVDVLGHLKWEQVQVVGDQVYLIYRTKNTNQRRRELPPTTAEVFKAYIRSLGDDIKKRRAVFPGTRQIQNIVRKRMDEVFGTGNRLTAHSIRHTGAMKCLQAGMSIGQIMNFLDDSSIRAAAIYVNHLSRQNDSADITRRLDARYSEFVKPEIDEQQPDLS